MKNENDNNLYNSSFEHDNCGIGAVVNISGDQTHYTVSTALSIVEQLEHRAGKDVTGQTGDGVGILTQIPHHYFEKVTKDFTLPQKGHYGVGMFFFPQDPKQLANVKQSLESKIEQLGLCLLGWRNVPHTPSVLGQKALDAMPALWQCFIKKPEDIEVGINFDRKLYQVRRLFEKENHEEMYVCSLSSRTIVYKGMFLVGQLRSFFNDLQDEAYESAIALVHSRFSTNTMPSWQRAHPNRFMVHNGEINTIKGNAANMLCREECVVTDKVDTDIVYPVVDVAGSDSSRLDNSLEFLVMGGMDLPKAVMMCIPEPFENNRVMSQSKKDFYAYNATLMEPWDGPASILFSDGDVMGAILDRNGLRPSRYYITDDNYLILASEVGAIPLAPEKIVVKERLRPGKMLLVDTKQGKLLSDEELKEDYSTRLPYGEWLENNVVHLSKLKVPNVSVPLYKEKELTQRQMVHGFSYEDVHDYILPMATSGGEPVIAMGNDAPIALLSSKQQPLFNYFKQLFAQVTNPPIDAIREEIVTATSLFIGRDGNILVDTPSNCQLIKINNPILSNTDMLKIKHMKQAGFKVVELPMTYKKGTSLKEALDNMFENAKKEILNGATAIIISDRSLSDQLIPIPSLLAVSGLHQYLVKNKLRNSTALIVESGEPREVHHFATLLGYGASAVNGYLVQDTIYQLVEEGLLQKDYHTAVEDYNHGVLHGITKIASKMGISTMQSYRGSKNFEALGISSELIEAYFDNTVSRIGGITLEDIEKMVLSNYYKAFDPMQYDVDLSLDSDGMHKARGGKEEHLYNPKTIHLLQQATKTGNYETYKQYATAIDQEGKDTNIRGMMEFKTTRKAVPLEEVESVEAIVKRFKTGAMSYGSISKEAHETMAIAMNHLGAKSNSGEGGEDVERFEIDEFGNNRCSAIKQVASGRFGVTSAYLCSAKEIQIKLAQGAKPGEGGQLPATKVYPWVAKTRHSTPGVGLISPPPHHDIYSIEDLAQLIYDLKNANTEARISVKLVSETGVGTIAAGVAKAGAGVVLISGYDGGTGAAPKNSVYNAGLPWELGLAEAHQTLIMNGLRSRVVLETDGKLMTGRDLAIATLLGAEEYGFATAPLVTMGCVMMRVCNLDTCPVGVATQNPILRKRFTGKPEYVENFMKFVAQDFREHMAMLGFRTVEEMVGHVELLETGEAYKADLARILDTTYTTNTNICYDPTNSYDFELEKVKDTTILLANLQTAIVAKEAKQLTVEIDNLDRSFGTILGSIITKHHMFGLEEDTYQITCNGSAGQSFGAFIPKGLSIKVFGDTNDYFGKGLSGGKLSVVPPTGSLFKPEDNIIVGNVAMYGATSGKVFVNGIAGERFAVRNSGAMAVVEGVGDHGLEYMTGGKVVVLGQTGRNFAAGMSGGIAYVYDPENILYKNLNKEMVEYGFVHLLNDRQELKEMIQEHVAHTASPLGQRILDDYEQTVRSFKKVIPHDYKKVTEAIALFQSQGMDYDQASIEAFNMVKKGVK
ncbi:glutamate synthase large subunit [Tannockella kyphosi]|uniref:glutamate synthase large subunit n=1 Tax=Tannockella kyphosi TaxID=2899121 RepID=UPI00201351EA|nr:glutamate synthase large subunit [Tannockella kyphosi]